VAAHVAQAGEAPESLVAAADQALYQAKATGRNRAVMAEKKYRK
jgi:PleD family two-component response regulator